MGAEINWDDLRFFLGAVRAGTLAGAAKSLGVEHTTVGRRLAALEKALGAPLVLRGPSGLRPTALGEKVTPVARDIERAVTALGDVVAGAGTRVRLAVPSGFAALLVPRLGELHASRPGLVLEILSGASPVDLASGEADLALRTGPLDDPALVVRKVCEVGWSLYAAPAYLARRPAPARLDDLGEHEVVGFDRSLAASPPARWLEGRGGRVVLRSREVMDMVAAASAGVGLAVLPCALAGAGLVRLSPEVLVARGLWLAYRGEVGRAAHVRAAIRFVVEALRKDAARIAGRRG